MWKQWQEKVKAHRHQFAANTIYVEQESPTAQEFEEVARTIRMPIDIGGKTRDVPFGARVVDNLIFGPITRMWLDSNVEFDFLRRHLFSGPLSEMSVLDIGAGYGRLAVSMGGLVRSFRCVDAVPISTEISAEYVSKFGYSNTHVLSLSQFIASYQTIKIDLAINVHSWNECDLAQIGHWLQVLTEMDVQYLFTVSHGQLESVPAEKRKQRAYYSWGNGQPSYRPLLEHDYEVIAEESIGLGSHPHALWRRRR